MHTRLLAALLALCSGLALAADLSSYAYDLFANRVMLANLILAIAMIN